MRASVAANTHTLSGCKLATAYKQGLPTIGRFCAKAKPCATPKPMRKPVNAPGPWAYTMLAMSLRAKPASANKRSKVGKIRVDCLVPTASWNVHMCSWAKMAKDKYEVEVSIAKIGREKSTFI